MQTIVDQPNLRILQTTGTEGPRHDPYSYTETVLERNGHRVEVHEGLAEWVEVDGARFDIYNGVDRAKGEAMVQEATGFTVREWERFGERLHTHRYQQHRAHDVVDMAGYPGEHFTYCQSCDKVLDSHFNINAVI